ncbi:MAG: hypothetical protein IJO10_03565 [Clostridia bacterium]|nr:hypothetical protein [Clostridia bacterium]
MDKRDGGEKQLRRKFRLRRWGAPLRRRRSCVRTHAPLAPDGRKRAPHGEAACFVCGSLGKTDTAASAR